MQKTWVSKLLVVGLVLGILGGALAWNAWDWLGTEGLDPARVKAMAKAYELKCRAAHPDTGRACKRHVGRRHRECLKVGVVRPTRKATPVYDEAGYERCMGAHQTADVVGADG